MDKARPDNEIPKLNCSSNDQLDLLPGLIWVINRSWRGFYLIAISDNQQVCADTKTKRTVMFYRNLSPTKCEVLNLLSLSPFQNGNLAFWASMISEVFELAECLVSFRETK